jgi:hypothetical protein
MSNVWICRQSKIQTHAFSVPAVQFGQKHNSVTAVEAITESASQAEVYRTTQGSA